MVEIPVSQSTVSVSIVNTTLRMSHFEVDLFIEGKRIAGHDKWWSAPSWAFKIVHPQQGTYLFDLGMRVDKENLAKPALDLINKMGWKADVEKDVAQLLKENGEDLNEVKGIIWSHWHWDHVGDPSTFPTSTKVIVGPGFKSAMLPGYPEDPNSSIGSDAWAGRELYEVEIAGDLVIGGYRALDFFGDGSFYLFDSPGHTVGHLTGFARTTPDPDSSFILMGGDSAHMIGQFRPSVHAPLPDRIFPDPREPVDRSFQSSCPCGGYVAIHPERVRNKPYYKGSSWSAHDHEESLRSTQKIEAFDGDDRVLIAMSHDPYLEEIIDVYPAVANQWKEKNWAKLAHWRFLGDFKPEVDA